jgi:hypothetical protein
MAASIVGSLGPNRTGNPLATTPMNFTWTVRSDIGPASLAGSQAASFEPACAEPPIPNRWQKSLNRGTFAYAKENIRSTTALMPMPRCALLGRFMGGYRRIRPRGTCQIASAMMPRKSANR